MLNNLTLNDYGFNLLIGYYENYDEVGNKGHISEKSLDEILDLLINSKKNNKLNLNNLTPESKEDVLGQIEGELVSDFLDIELVKLCKPEDLQEAKKTIKQFKNILNKTEEGK